MYYGHGIGGWGGYHNREIVLPCLLACTHARTHAHSWTHGLRISNNSPVRLSVRPSPVSVFLVFLQWFCDSDVICWGMSRGFCSFVNLDSMGLQFARVFSSNLDLEVNIWRVFGWVLWRIAFCTCFLVCFQCLLYGFLLDRILHVFSRANLQVSRLNNETVDFPRVLSIKVGLLLIAI